MKKLLIHFLLILNALLLLLFAVEWFWLHSDETVAEPVDHIADSGAEDSLPVMDFSGQSLDKYIALVEKPLFIQGRKPVESVEEKLLPETSSDIEQLALMGVYSLEGEYFALVDDKSAQTKKYFKKKKGDSIAGWVIEQIEPDRIVLLRGGQKKTVMLRKPKPKKASLPRPGRPPVKRRLPSRSKIAKPS